MMKKLFLSLPLLVVALMISFSARAQQTSPATEDVAYELPAMVSPKTIPLFDDTFANMPGVKVNFYCYSLNLIVLSVDRDVQKDNAAIEQKIHGIFHTDNNSLRLESKQSFNKDAYVLMCNEQDLIKR